MKRIDITKMINDNDLYYEERKEILGMEFIKLKDGNYMIKNSNGRIVNKREKLKLEKNELIIEDFKSNNCQKENVKKIQEIDKELDNGSIKKTKSTKRRYNSKK